MSYQITRKLEFDAGHRIYGHESKCANLHGHRYVAHITCEPAIEDELDNLGRVVDFSVIKTKVGDWIDEMLDHGMILWVKDPLCYIWRCFGSDEMRSMVSKHTISDRVFDIEKQKCFIMDDNPTAENIAKLIYRNARDCLQGHGINVTKVTLFETPNCSADYSE